MSSEHKGLVVKQLETVRKWKAAKVKVKEVDVLENTGYICRGGRQVAIEVAHIEYKDENEHWRNGIYPPDIALVLSDKDFKRAKVSQAVLVTGRVREGMMMESFIDEACAQAECNGGANCLKKRTPKKSP